MTNKEFVLDMLCRFARSEAIALQEAAENMTPDEIIEDEILIPMFNPSRQYLDYNPGYICKTQQGNVVRLLQPYDSTIYTQSPEELPAQWGFYWSTNPKKAKVFLASATSPYYKGSCCIYNEHVWKSKIDNNIWSPSDYAQGWEDLGSA